MNERRDNPKWRAQREFEKRSTVPLQIRFNIRTDADIIARLAAQDNKQGYIKRLIRADIAAGNVAGWREAVITAIEMGYTVERAENGALTFTPKK